LVFRGAAGSRLCAVHRHAVAGDLVGGSGAAHGPDAPALCALSRCRRAATTRTGQEDPAHRHPHGPHASAWRIRSAAGGVGGIAMRRWLRILGTILIVAGALTLIWSLLVWQ